MRTTVDATILYKGKRYTPNYIHKGVEQTAYIFHFDRCTIAVEHSPEGTATVTTIMGFHTFEDINNMNLYERSHQVDFAIGEEEVDEYVERHINTLYTPNS